VVHEPVLTEVLAVVAGDDEERVVESPLARRPSTSSPMHSSVLADLGVVEAAEELHVVGVHLDRRPMYLSGCWLTVTARLASRSPRCRRTNGPAGGTADAARGSGMKAKNGCSRRAHCRIQRGRRGSRARRPCRRP
jgi:hypothetical protein